MDKRKKILIDKRFQFKTIFSVIGMVYFLISIVIAAVTVYAVINNKKLNEIIKRQENTLETQRDVLDALFIFSKEKNWKNLRLAKNEISKDIKTNLDIIQENTIAVNKIIEYNTKLLYGIIIFIIYQAGLLYYLLLKISHRISGPIHHISEYIHDIINRKYPKIRPLRKNDYLKEFHELIVKMVESFEKK